MIEIDDKTLRKLQLIQLEMLIEVDRICRKCDIKYNIIGGTMLGAVRHSGYIPWDDDADIGFLREEYEKFCRVCAIELDQSRFYFQDHCHTEGYRWGYAKLRRKNTLFVRENQEHMKYEQGVFIDIFPFDGVPDNYVLRCFQDWKCFLLRKILWSTVGKIVTKNKMLKVIYSILDRIPLEIIQNYYNKLILKSNQTTTNFVRVLLFPTPNRTLGFQRIWFQKQMQIEFENYMFFVAEDYKEYLSFEFGDYMSFPPKEKRKTHPVSILKLL